jgi:hypothetical protein
MVTFIGYKNKSHKFGTKKANISKTRIIHQEVLYQ